MTPTPATPTTEKWTIAVGDAFHGVTLHGIFDSPEEAVEYAGDHYDRTDIWAAVPIEKE